MRALVAGFTALMVTAGCTSTVDSLGYNEAAALSKVTAPASYPDPLRDVLGQSDAAITAKINAVYQQLFHSDTTNLSIFITSGADQAYIYDVLHGQVRTEGMGLGMMIAVELNKQDDFDQLWRYAKGSLQVQSGSSAGYFTSFCDSADQMTSAKCLDPYGFEQFVTALIFAHDQWTSAGSINYQADALALLHTMLHKVDDNGGVVDGVTNMFDATTKLPFSLPDVMDAGQTRPSIVMPGYYAVWAQATGDSTWSAAATAARAFWPTTANATTGLTPIRASFNGTPLPNWAIFDPESYRTQINMVIDQIWTAGTAFNVTEANRLLSFFSSQGINTYGTAYSLDGTNCTNPTHEPSLVVANAVAAGISTNAVTDRVQYLNALWTMQTPTGMVRYYTGILELTALLILGGQFKVL